MALVFILEIGKPQSDCGSFTITDKTVYGGANDDRNERANFLFVTKTDIEGARTLLTIVPDSADAMVVTEWEVSITLDGWVEKFLASLSLYSGGATYNTGDIFYNESDDKIYKTKQDGVTGQAAPNTTYYDEITAASLYTTELENDSIDWAMQDDKITCRTEARIRDAHAEFGSDFRSGKCGCSSFSQADYLDGLLNSAVSAFDNGRPQDGEEIIRGMENYVFN